MVGLGLGAAVLGLGSFPFWYTQHHREKNKKPLAQMDRPIGSQQRAAYVNTGSKDIGVDPDYDFKNRIHKSDKRKLIDEKVAAHREKLKKEKQDV